MVPTGQSAAQKQAAELVQISGVVMTADSLRAVAGTAVTVRGRTWGGEAGDRGVFSIVAYKGDTLQFQALGYRDKQYIIPRDREGQYFSMIQLMVQDTFYLPETIVRPLPNRENFDYAFRNWRIPHDQYEIARRNTDALTLRALAYTLPKAGPEFQAAYQAAIQRRDGYFYGQNPNLYIPLLDPVAWGQFFQAWKRGDFRRKYGTSAYDQ